MGVDNGLPSACHCKHPHRSDANILSCDMKQQGRCVSKVNEY